MVAGLLLAAGNGSRMGQPKAALEIDGVRLVDRAVALFQAAGITEIFVVLGAWVGEVPGATVLINEGWQEGMGSSLRIGLEAISQDQRFYEVVVSLVDLPGLTAAALTKVAQYPGELVMATYHGKNGHPVKFSRSHWSGIIESAQGDVGARTYLADQKRHKSRVEYIALDDLATGNDLDSPEDLVQFKH